MKYLIQDMAALAPAAQDEAFLILQEDATGCTTSTHLIPYAVSDLEDLGLLWIEQSVLLKLLQSSISITSLSGIGYHLLPPRLQETLGDKHDQYVSYTSKSYATTIYLG